MNGPSGKALDDFYLQPLGIKRDKAWLCDLVPHSCMNSAQEKAITEKYNPLVEKSWVPKSNIPRVPKTLLDESRELEILNELKLANPKLLILLGDEPIKWLISRYSSYRKLSDFYQNQEGYGKVTTIMIVEKEYNILPLIHPRQAAGLGHHSESLRNMHSLWLKTEANNIRMRYDL